MTPHIYGALCVVEGHENGGLQNPALYLPNERIKRASTFRIKTMRELKCLDTWVNAVGNPDYDVEDPIERQMIYDLFNEQPQGKHD